jgi:hypothetical protein
MADEADIASSENSRENIIMNDTLTAIRNQAAAIPVGEPGDCDGCGYHFSRLVKGYCGRCRDRLRLH